MKPTTTILLAAALAVSAACGAEPSVADRAAQARTCAELELVAIDVRDPHLTGPDGLGVFVDQPDTARAAEIRDGLADLIAVVARAEQLGC